MERLGAQLEVDIDSLCANPNQAKLVAAQQAWRNVRAVWEQSEGYLFGPVATEQLDPGIDTWPVNKNDFDSVLAATSPINDAWLANAQEALKGFHPLEYLLFGEGSAPNPATYTTRQKAYMKALATYIHGLCNRMKAAWNPADAQSYYTTFSTAGTGSTEYATRKNALEELVQGMAGICEEVADGKIETPLAAMDPSLEESPFSQNSLEDFRNNMRSVRNVYTCTYGGAQGTSVSSWVAAHNRALDARLLQQMDAAIRSFDQVTLPFGQAILQQRQQLHSVQATIRQLATTLSIDLQAHVQQFAR